MSGSYLCGLPAWSLRTCWSAKSSFLPASSDHTRYAGSGHCPSVRFLVENAGSMKDVHFVAFCKLLGLPYEKPFDQYTGDLAKFTCFIARKRNFFRNMADVEPITELGSWPSEDSGPLLTISGDCFCASPSYKKDAQLWDLPLIMDLVSAASISLGLLLLGGQGCLPALL